MPHSFAWSNNPHVIELRPSCVLLDITTCNSYHHSFQQERRPTTDAALMPPAVLPKKRLEPTNRRVLAFHTEFRAGLGNQEQNETN